LKAVVKTKPGDGFVELIQIPEPEAGKGDLLVHVERAGICGSDLNIFHGTFEGYKVPVVMGHEFAGTVENAHPSSGFTKGERVACETHAYVCNDCEYCRSGKYNLCPSRRGFGYGVDGAFAKYVKVRSALAHRLPDGISMDEGAMLEPLSVALNALTNSIIRAGDSMLIIGPGPIGLMCSQIARLSGANAMVMGSEGSTFRLKVAESLGATTITDRQLRDELGKSRTGRFDLTVLATGRASSFETALLATKPGGQVVQIGESVEMASFQFSLIERKNLTIHGSFSHTWPVWEKAISLVNDRRIDLLSLATHRIPIEAWREGFDLTERRNGLKVLIRP
jgi:L-iditol 2-dehydrogenase